MIFVANSNSLALTKEVGLVKEDVLTKETSITLRQLSVILFTVAGFIAAIIANILIPQIATDVTFEEYEVLGGTLDMNGAYRIVLLFIIAAYGVTGFVKVRDKAKWKDYEKRSQFRFATGLALGVWDLLGTKLEVLPQPFFPGPAGIVRAFLMEGDFIWENTLYSIRLFAIGFIFGVIFGVGTGILIGWFPKVYYWVSPVLNITGVIPAVAWMPFALTLFPTPFSAAVFLIVICVWFPVASLTASGVQSTPKAQFEVARTLGGNTAFLVFRVAVPHAMPQIFTGVNTASAFAFTTLVMAEMMGQPGGLGYYINASKVWSAYYKVFAAIIVMAILFGLITKVVGLIEAHVLRWQRGLLK